MKIWIISLGGSIVAPSEVDFNFVNDFYSLINEYIKYHEHKFVLVVGGGAPARLYQQAYRDLLNLQDRAFNEDVDFDALDRIGIAATHLNAQFVREVFGELAVEEIITNPEDSDIEFERPVLVGAGWKPGFSTDLDAVKLAERFGAEIVINLSNIAQIYSADPQVDPNAQALTHISWETLIDMVGDEWQPGMHAPLDPVACRLASDLGLEVITAEGRDLENLRLILDGKEFFGTRISHE